MKNKKLFTGGALLIAALMTLAMIGCPSPANPSRPQAGDKTALTQKVAEAEELLRTTPYAETPEEAPNGKHYVSEETYYALQDAITSAKAVLKKSGATQSQINTALADLNSALAAFTSERENQTGTGDALDVSTLVFWISQAETLISGAAVAENAAEVPQDMPYVTSAQKAAFQQAIDHAKAALLTAVDQYVDVDAAAAELEDAYYDFQTLLEDQMGENDEWTFTITFDLNYTGAGDNPPDITIENVFTVSDSDEELPVPEERAGYYFTGWYWNSEGTGAGFTETTNIAGNITLYARWRVAYELVYHLNGGKLTGETLNADGNLVTVYLEGEALILPAPVKNGAVFDGWYDNAGFTGAAATSIPADSTGNKAFWAKWKHYEYDLKFNGSFANDSADGLPPEVYSFKDEGTLWQPMAGGSENFLPGLGGRQAFQANMLSGYIRLDDNRDAPRNDSAPANGAPAATAFNYNQSFTVAFWVRVNSAGLNGDKLVLFSNRGLSTGSWVTDNSTGLAFYVDGAGNNRSIKLHSKSAADSGVLDSGAITIRDDVVDAWVHIAAVYDKAVDKVIYYADGVKIGEENTDLSTGIGGGFVSYIGTSASTTVKQYTNLDAYKGTAGMNFLVQDFILKTGAMTDEQVAALSSPILGTLTAPVLTCAAGTGDAQITYSWTAAAQAGVVYKLYIARGNKTAVELETEEFLYLTTQNAVTSPATYVAAGYPATDYSVMVTAARGTTTLKSSVVTVTSSGQSPNPVLTFATGTTPGEISYSFTAGIGMSGHKLWVIIGAPEGDSNEDKAAYIKENGFLIHTASSDEQSSGVLATIVKGNPGLEYSAVLEAENSTPETIYSNVASNVPAAGTYSAATSIAHLKKEVSASSTWPNAPVHVAESAVDNNLATRWSAASNAVNTSNSSKSCYVALTFGLPVQVGSAGLIDAGPATQDFSVEYYNGTSWVSVYNYPNPGTTLTLGNAATTSGSMDQITAIPFTGGTVQATQIRLVIKRATATSPSVWEFYLYGPSPEEASE